MNYGIQAWSTDRHQHHKERTIQTVHASQIKEHATSHEKITPKKKQNNQTLNLVQPIKSQDMKGPEQYDKL